MTEFLALIVLLIDFATFISGAYMLVSGNIDKENIQVSVAVTVYMAVNICMMFKLLTLL